MKLSAPFILAVVAAISCQAVELNRTIIPLPEPKFEGKIGQTYKESEGAWPKLPAPPEGAPNVLVILLDDVGFGQTAIARKLRKADTWAEQLLWRWLRDRRFSAYKFRRQQPMGAHTLDFFCNEAKLNIELDGTQHGHPEHAQADAERDRWLEERGIKVLRYWNGRLRREKQVVRDAIWQTLQERVPKPLPDYCRPGIVGAKGPGENVGGPSE